MTLSSSKINLLDLTFVLSTIYIFYKNIFLLEVSEKYICYFFWFH